MPGAQELRLVALDKYDLSIKVRPESLWRFIPILGSLRMFRLGAGVTFRLNIETKRILDRESGWSQSTWTERFALVVADTPYGTQSVTFNVPKTIGGKISALTEPYFLQVTGDTTLRLSSGSGRAYSCYAFRVWEPALSMVNWGMALIAGVLGGVIGWAIR